MAITVQEIKSEGIEDQWLAFAKHHWDEHVSDFMRDRLDVDIATIQHMETVDVLSGFVAMDDGVTVGYALVTKGASLFSKSTREWTVLCIYTHPKVRRSGAFSTIMAELEQKAREDGALVLTMMAPYNFKADNYMQASGFSAQEVAYRKELR